jgi:hypothetical protein
LLGIAISGRSILVCPSCCAQLSAALPPLTDTPPPNPSPSPRPPAEIVMFDDVLVVYKCLGDLMFYVTGGQDENELILYSVLQAFYESVSILLRCARAAWEAPRAVGGGVAVLPHGAAARAAVCVPAGVCKQQRLSSPPPLHPSTPQAAGRQEDRPGEPGPGAAGGGRDRGQGVRGRAGGRGHARGD